jgi:hypothetical protein
MIPTFLDLRTGKTAKSDDMSVFWWTEGNGACDCKRAIAFGLRHLDGEVGFCLGYKRFIAIDVEGDLEYDEDHDGKRTTHTKEQVLTAMNSEYGT